MRLETLEKLEDRGMAHAAQNIAFVHQYSRLLALDHLSLLQQLNCIEAAVSLAPC